MIIRTGIVYLTATLAFTYTGLSEGTNETLNLFGITVTEKASEAETQFTRGHAYYTGAGAEQDYEKAVACFRKSAELGHAQAQFNLGICCLNGTGLEQNDKEAVRWLKQAVDNGVTEALYPLGLAYYNLEQYTEAYAWALYAEEKGDARLRTLLQPMYSEEEIAKAKIRFEALKKELAGKTVAPDSDPEN